MPKAATVTIPVTFEIREFLEYYRSEGLNRRKFYEIARSAKFKREMSKLLYEDFVNNGGLDELSFFDDAFDPDYDYSDILEST